MLIYTDQRSKTTRKQRAKQKRAWEVQQSQYGKSVGSKFTPLTCLPRVPVRADGSAYKQVASVKTNQLDTFKPAVKQYTGTAMIGIATMHKSNSIPVFSTENAKEVAQMRRN